MKSLLKDEKLAKVDISLADLKDLENKPILKSVIDFIDDFWVGKSRERATSVKVGTVNVKLNSERKIEMNFVTRFSLEDHPELITKLKEELG